jgi:hypothetical protein
MIYDEKQTETPNATTGYVVRYGCIGDDGVL